MERRIAAAIADGLLDDLPTDGRPLNLDEYFATPEHLRMAYSILKSAGYLPEEVELMKQIQQLTQRGEAALSQEDARRLRDLRLTLAVKVEQLRRAK
jgi:hypothetical protein